MLLKGPFAMLSMPSFDFHLPPCTEGFLIHLSPLWQLPLWQLPLFPSVIQFPCVGNCDITKFVTFSKRFITYIKYVITDYNKNLFTTSLVIITSREFH